ncbi:MAG: cation:proton antiporter [Candidatus Omnitrophota bacterium]
MPVAILENPILSLGVLFLVCFFFTPLMRKLRIPTITIYVLVGMIFSRLISSQLFAASDFFSNLVLGIIAFSLGESLSGKTFSQVGRIVTSISIFASVVPCILVTLAFWLIFNIPFYIALVLGAIASATAPAATVAITQEYKSRGEFTDTLLGIVAVDDAWALMLFGLALSLANSFANNNSLVSGFLIGSTRALIEIVCSLLIGITIAVLFDRFSSLINSAKDRLIYTLGFLFLTVGVAITAHFSVLLSCMFFGAVLANTHRTSFEFFDSVREIDVPLYLIFFVLAGAHLNFEILIKSFSLMMAFVVFRVIGKIIGSFFGAKFIGASYFVSKYMGLALLPQAGVALGCALVAKHTLNNYWGDWILNITIAATIVFELVGPWITKYALVKAGEITE